MKPEHQCGFSPARWARKFLDDFHISLLTGAIFPFSLDGRGHRLASELREYRSGGSVEMANHHSD
jgi:hypothetical protein